MTTTTLKTYLIVCGAALAAAGCAEPARGSTPTGPTPTEAMLSVGAAAPSGVLTTSDGKRLALERLWKTAPTVVVFYRGHW